MKWLVKTDLFCSISLKKTFIHRIPTATTGHKNLVENGVMSVSGDVRGSQTSGYMILKITNPRLFSFKNVEFSAFVF